MKGVVELALLELSSGAQHVPIEDVSSRTGLSHSTLKQKLSFLIERQLISFNGDFVDLGGAQRVLLAEELVRSGLEPRRASLYLRWQEFEEFALSLFRSNGFRTVRHVVFKSPEGRREIDLLAWNDIFLFAIDCKHWVGSFSPSRMREAASAQSQRATALAARPEILRRLSVQDLPRRLIQSLVLMLGDGRDRFVDGVAFIPVSKLCSFLAEVSPADEHLRCIAVSADRQTSLFRFHRVNA